MTAAQIEAIIAAYGVRSANKRGDRANAPRYVVVCRGVILPGDYTHGEARAEMGRLIASEIMALQERDRDAGA